jgi:hypothetical protein
LIDYTVAGVRWKEIPGPEYKGEDSTGGWEQLAKRTLSAIKSSTKRLDERE